MKDVIKNAYEAFVSENGGQLPNVLYGSVIWKGEPSAEGNVAIVIGHDFEGNDEEILYYAQDLNEIILLCDEENGEDFVISSFSGFGIL